MNNEAIRAYCVERIKKLKRDFEPIAAIDELEVLLGLIDAKESSFNGLEKPIFVKMEAVNNSFCEVTNDWDRKHECERWLRSIDPKCWISVLYRRTGFGHMEWETAIVFLIEPGSRPKRWESDDRDCLIIGGDRREELAEIPKEQLRQWFAENIDGNRNSMDSLIQVLKETATP